MIRMYTTPGCVQCRMTSDFLAKAGIKPEVIDHSQSPDGLAAVKAMGYASAPVIITDSDHWSGFRPDKLMHWLNTREVA